MAQIVENYVLKNPSYIRISGKTAENAQYCELVIERSMNEQVNVNISHILTPKWQNFLKFAQAKIGKLVSPA